MDKKNRVVCPKCKHRFTVKKKQPDLTDGWVSDTDIIKYAITVGKK